MADNRSFIVNSKNRNQYGLKNTGLTVLSENEITAKVEKFGFTSNNITYASLAETIPYLKFFPDVSNEENGILPVWGIAKVTESKHPEIRAGQRFFGFLPAAEYVQIRPSSANSSGFTAERKQIKPEYGFYNSCSFLDKDVFYEESLEDEMTVFRPLFLTGILVADWLEFNEYRSADTVVISSASSKTSYGIAKAVKSNEKKCRLIGLASERNTEFCRSLKVYDEVISYDRVEEISADYSVLYADVAGSEPLRERLGAYLGERLKLVLSVGMSHGSTAGFQAGILGERFEIFFAPGWMMKRRRRLPEKIGHIWKSQIGSVGNYFRTVRKRGLENFEKDYADFLSGKINPSESLLFEL